jgi:hypothetical protein
VPTTAHATRGQLEGTVADPEVGAVAIVEGGTAALVE